MSRVLLSLLTATTLGGLLLTTPGQARDRYATPPPLVLSSDLSSPWSLQLRGAPRAVRSGVAVSPKRATRKTRVKKARTLWRKRPQRKAHLTTASVKPAQPALDTALLPATVSWHGRESTGSIVINTFERRLYLVLPDGRARRYAVGVGKPGFEWAGSHKVTRKATWPSWTPPKEMILRERKKGRELPAFMEGGPGNPMGARALYLGSSIYRIHGTNQDWSIGKAVSSGCIRMRNEDVMDLYERVPVGARVTVI